jgi:hypothetical protein
MIAFRPPDRFHIRPGLTLTQALASLAASLPGLVSQFGFRGIVTLFLTLPSIVILNPSASHARPGLCCHGSLCPKDDGVDDHHGAQVEMQSKREHQTSNLWQDKATTGYQPSITSSFRAWAILINSTCSSSDGTRRSLRGRNNQARI